MEEEEEKEEEDFIIERESTWANCVSHGVPLVGAKTGQKFDQYFTFNPMGTWNGQLWKDFWIN